MAVTMNTAAAHRLLTSSLFSQIILLIPVQCTLLQVMKLSVF